MKHEDIPKLLESAQGQKNAFLPRQQPSGTISEGSALAGFLATAPTAPEASSKVFEECPWVEDTTSDTEVVLNLVARKSGSVATARWTPVENETNECYYPTFLADKVVDGDLTLDEATARLTDDSNDEWIRLLEKWSKLVGGDEFATPPGVDAIEFSGHNYYRRVLVENDLGDTWYALAGHDRGGELDVEQIEIPNPAYETEHHWREAISKEFRFPGINVVETDIIDECEEVSDMITELLSAIESLVAHDPSAYGQLMKSFDAPPKEDWLCGSETKYNVLAHLDHREVMMAEEIVAYIGGQPYLIKSRTDDGVICFLPTKPDLVVAAYYTEDAGSLYYTFRDGKILATKTLELK